MNSIKKVNESEPKTTVFTVVLLCDSGADDRIRTGDLTLTKRLLYQLSYVGNGQYCAKTNASRQFLLRAD